MPSKTLFLVSFNKNGQLFTLFTPQSKFLINFEAKWPKIDFLKTVFGASLLKSGYFSVMQYFGFILLTGPGLYFPTKSELISRH